MNGSIAVKAVHVHIFAKGFHNIANENLRKRGLTTAK